MRRLKSFRFFCSHYCFQVFDSKEEPWGQPSEIDGLESDEATARIMRGWTRSGESIRYHTMSHGNDHRIDVYLAKTHTMPHDADRVLAHNLSLPSGTLMT